MKAGCAVFELQPLREMYPQSERSATGTATVHNAAATELVQPSPAFLSSVLKV